jgi:hypothetical protein
MEVAQKKRLPLTFVGPRQGGVSLTAIFTKAGADAGKIQLCRNITADMEAVYRAGRLLKDGTPRIDTINKKDIGSWCGIFAFYIYQTAGLSKLRPWMEKRAHSPKKK